MSCKILTPSIVIHSLYQTKDCHHFYQSPILDSSSSSSGSGWVHVMAPMNKQWLTKMDGLDKLELKEEKMPEPKEGEVLVKIHAVSLNYRDIAGT